jgi:PPOX class probable F420-dependent enzyme
MATLTDAQAALLLGKNWAAVGTIRKDGSAQVTPTWIDWDGTHVLVNTALGRAKERNMSSGRPVTVMVYDHENPARYISITGTATLSTDGAEDHIDKMAFKYEGHEKYPDTYRTPGEVRVIARITTDKLDAFNV